jgi:hypothetical protein
MRRASFQHTQEQMRMGALACRATPDGYSSLFKDITRRLNWQWAKKGMFLLAVSKCQGIRPGERVETFGVIEILDVQRWNLWPLGDDDVRREGFPGMTGVAFTKMFCEHMGCRADVLVTRVVFRHVDWRRGVHAAAYDALTSGQLLALRRTDDERKRALQQNEERPA